MGLEPWKQGAKERESLQLDRGWYRGVRCGMVVKMVWHGCEDGCGMDVKMVLAWLWRWLRIWMYHGCGCRVVVKMAAWYLACSKWWTYSLQSASASASTSASTSTSTSALLALARGQSPRANGPRLRRSGGIWQKSVIYYYEAQADLHGMWKFRVIYMQYYEVISRIFENGRILRRFWGAIWENDILSIKGYDLTKDGLYRGFDLGGVSEITRVSRRVRELRW